MWMGQAGDILENDELFYAITEEQKLIIEFEGDLIELDTNPLNILDEETPLAYILKPLGMLDLKKGIEQKMHNITTES